VLLLFRRELQFSYRFLYFSGNELSGHGIGAKVDAKLYGKDVIELKSMLRKLYKAPLSQPLLLAPGGFFDQQWYSQLLQTSGHGAVSALTHHVYNLGGGM
jgi:heparanase